MNDTLEQKLEAKFEASRYHSFCAPGKRTAFLWCAMHDAAGTRYGSYKTVREDELAKRQYVLEEHDYAVGILYTDIVYEPRWRRDDRKA